MPKKKITMRAKGFAGRTPDLPCAVELDKKSLPKYRGVGFSTLWTLGKEIVRCCSPFEVDL